MVEVAGNYIDTFKCYSIAAAVAILGERYPSMRVFGALDGSQDHVAMLTKPCGEPYEMLAYIRKCAVPSKHLICIDCGQDETENAEGDFNGERFVQRPRECPKCGGDLEWKFEPSRPLGKTE